MLNRLLRIAAFQNPEFYKAQAMRLSTFDKPRVIACGEDLPRHIALPRGCLGEVLALIEGHGIKTILSDERFAGMPIDVELVDCETQDQHASDSAPPTVARPVAGTAGDVPRNSNRRGRPNRRGQNETNGKNRRSGHSEPASRETSVGGNQVFVRCVAPLFERDPEESQAVAYPLRIGGAFSLMPAANTSVSRSSGAAVTAPIHFFA